MLQHALPYISFQIRMVWDDLQHVTTYHRQIYKKIYFNILKKMMMIRHGNPLHIAQNHVNLRENIR